MGEETVRLGLLEVMALIRFGNKPLWKPGLAFKLTWIALQCGAILLLSVALPIAYKVLPASLVRQAPEAEVMAVAYGLMVIVLAWSCVSAATTWLRFRRSDREAQEGAAEHE